MAAVQDKSSKSLSKQLRLKANEFLSSRRNSNVLVELLEQLENGTNQPGCLLTLELVFTELLRRGDMYQEVVPLKPADDGPEAQYRCWLRRNYEEGFGRIVRCIETGRPAAQTQAVATAMKIIAFEGRYPLESRGAASVGETQHFPMQKLKMLLMKLLSSERSNVAALDKFHEYASYADVLQHSWRALPPLTPKTHPNETFISNYLDLVDRLPLDGAAEGAELCRSEEDGNGGARTEQAVAARRALNKAWGCVMHWQHTATTHRRLLVVLLERVLAHLDRPLALADFLLDSLDAGGATGLLALQAVVTLVHEHNLDYPALYTKLYSMFEPEIFHTKFKARLLYLSELLLASTHLPEMLVAAFVKRLARLALVAPPSDVPAICALVGALLRRHPGLKALAGRASAVAAAASDPYIMEERDPLKSNAVLSCLWELRALQAHTAPTAAAAATRLLSGQDARGAAPSELDLGRELDRASSDAFDREVRKRAREIAVAFERPPARHERLALYWKLQ